MNPNLVPWWGWLLAGAVGFLIFQSVILFDDWAIWLAKRKNSPILLFVLGIPALLYSVVSIVRAIWEPFVKVVGKITFEWWILVLVGFGLFSIAIFAISKMVKKNKAKKDAQDSDNEEEGEQE
jgi:drug/metabolite transporter (DMT)-like permease